MMRKFKGSRRLLAIAASLTMLTGLFSTGFVAAAVREAAALEEGGAITAEAMKDVSYLDLAGAGVVSLYGLEYAENLMWLDLSGNPDIQAIPAGLFDGMPGLGYVDLSGLSLSALPDNLFKTQIDDMTSRLDNTVWDEYGWDDPVYFTLIMGRMPAKAELWDDMRALRTALEAVQTKGDEVFAAEPEAEESPALIEVQMGLALIYPSKLEALEAENGQLIHLQDLAGTETIDTASAAKLLTVMCMTVADLFDFDLLDLLDIPDAPGMPDSLVLNDLLVKDFNGLMDTGDEEMNEQFLASLIESAQMAEIDVADSYADFNAFFADLLKKAQGIDYKAGDPVSAPLLALLNEAAEALGYSKAQTFVKIILPQVVKRVLPPVTNETITLVKDTSMAFTISIAEMFTVAKQIGAAQTSVLPLLAAGVFYYIFNLVVASFMEYLEKKTSYYR